jgi:STE24 endopeptidase
MQGRISDLGFQDLLYIPVAALQERLSFVTTDPLPWKSYVLVVSWTLAAFETYLL